MSDHQSSTTETVITPAPSIAAQPWWPQLHQLIVAAFLHKPEDVTVFPPDWRRLPDGPNSAAQSFASELGDHGYLIVLLQDGQPIAGTGVLPYRGASWINDAQSGKSDADIANTVASSSAPGSGDKGRVDWEVCSFCVSAAHRGLGLAYRLLDIMESFIKERGAMHLYANYAEIETGNFWPRMGFQVIPGAGGMLKKGFKVHPEKEGLRDDIVFTMAVKTLS